MGPGIELLIFPVIQGATLIFISEAKINFWFLPTYIPRTT